MSADHEDVGYLTWAQFQRVGKAVSTGLMHVSWWRVAGYLKPGNDPDEFRGSRVKASSLPLGLPATWLAADEVTRLLNELNRWRELEDAANDVGGADMCMLLVNEVETAAAKWPIEDKPHEVKFFRCTACNLMTLKYFPPEITGRELVDSKVKCMNKTCNAIVDELMFARMAFVIEAEQKAKDERARQLAKSHRSALESEQISVDYLLMGASGQGANDASGQGIVAVSA